MKVNNTATLQKLRSLNVSQIKYREITNLSTQFMNNLVTVEAHNSYVKQPRPLTKFIVYPYSLVKNVFNKITASQIYNKRSICTEQRQN